MAVTIRFGRGLPVVMGSPPAPVPANAITTDQMGVPGGVATLDQNSKIEREQIQMAYETEEALEELTQAVQNIEAVGVPDPGDLTLIFDNQLI